MADLPPETGARPTHERGAGPGMPRWVKVGILVLVLVVVVILVLTFAGVHEPRPGAGHGP